MASSCQEDFDDLWRHVLAEEVERVSQYSDIPTNQWRHAGRKTKDKPNGEDLSWWAEAGAQQLQGYADWLASTTWTFAEFNGEPLIEANISGQIGDHFVKGFLDAVMHDGERYILVDYKSGSRTPFGLMQLGCYRVMLRNLTGIDATHGSFFMTRKSEMTEPAELHKYTDEYVGRIFNQFNLAVENEVFLPNEGSHCWSCDVRSACYVQGGVDAWKFDPDHPSYNLQQIADKNAIVEGNTNGNV